MKKIAYVSSLMLMLCSFFMFGCTDKYKNLNISLDKEEIIIELTDNEVCSETVTATVTGAKKGVSTQVTFSTDATNITINQKETVGNATACEIIANADATGDSAVVKVTTKEGNKSKYITVKLVRKLTSVTANANYKPAVSLNGSLKIDAGEALSMVPANTTQKNFIYTLVNNYQGISLTEGGILTVGSVMPSSGYVTIKATNSENSNLFTTFDIAVVQGISLRDQVKLFVDDILQETIEIAPNKQAKHELYFSSTLTADDYYYTFYVGAKTNDITVSGTNQHNVFSITANATITESINTAILVTASVTGYDSKYASFTFEVPVKLKNVPTSILVTTKDQVTGTSTTVAENETVEIYDIYSESSLGTALTVLLSPYGIEEADSTYSLNEMGDTNYLNVLDIVYSDKQTVTSLTGLNNASTLYFKVKPSVILTEDIEFEVQIVSDYDNLLAQTIKFKLVKGIHSIQTLQNENQIEELKIINGNIAEFEIKAYGIDLKEIEITSNNITVETSKDASQTIELVQDTSNLSLFNLTALNCGECEITFIANNGIFKTLKVLVYEPVVAFTAYFDMPNSNIGEQTYHDISTTSDITMLGSVKNIVFAINTTLNISVDYFSDTEKQNKVNATVTDVYLTSEDLTTITAFNKTYLTGVETSSTPTAITLHILGYDINGEQVELTYTFTAQAYVPLSQVQLNYNTLTILDSDTLSALDSTNGEVVLELRMSPSNATFEGNSAQVTWTTSDSNIINLNSENLRSNQTAVTAHLAGGYSKIVTVTATVTQYSRTYTQTCSITVESCKKVTDINITNLKSYTDQDGVYYDMYFNATKGLLNLANDTTLPNNPTGIGNQNFKDINTSTYPTDVTNSKVVYIVTDSKSSDGADSELSIVRVSSNGRVFANAAGTCSILVTPADNLTVYNGETNVKTVIYNGKQYKIVNEELINRIKVQIADGTEQNKIRIENISDLLSINTTIGLTLHYEQTADIDLSSISNLQPFGYILNSATGLYEIQPFTGSYKGSYTSNNKTYQFALTNANLQAVTVGTTYSGLFAINEGRISDIALSVNRLSYNLQYTSTAKLSCIAGYNKNEITNCEVTLNNVNLQNLAGNITFGSITAVNDNKVSFCNVYGDITLSYGAITNIYVGGVAGQNYGTIKNTENAESDSSEAEYLTSFNFSNVNVMLNISTENPNLEQGAVAFGGIVGSNYATISNYTFGGIINGFVKVAGIVGENLTKIIEAITYNGKIENCVNQGNVYGTNYVGGIVAYNAVNQDNTIQNCRVENYNYLGKSENHSIIVGENNVGGIIGYNQLPQEITLENSANIVTDCYFVSYYSQKGAVQTYTAGADYTTDTYYGDLLVISSTGVYNPIAVNANYTNCNYNFNLQVIATITQELSNPFTDYNTIPTAISVSANSDLEAKFADKPTKIDNTTLILPYFVTTEDVVDYAKNTFKISDLISVTAQPTNATPKYIVQSANTNVISLDNKGNLYVVGLGSVTLTISSIFNSCAPATIKIITSYPIGEVKYVNASGATIEELTLKKQQSKQLIPTMTYSIGSGDHTVYYKTIVDSNVEITSELSEENFVQTDKATYNLNSPITVTGIAKTENIITLELTPSVTVEGGIIPTNLTTQEIKINVVEGATDITFSANNPTVSQVDVLEFIVYVHTDVEFENFGYEIEKDEVLSVKELNSELQLTYLETEDLENGIFAVKFAVQLANSHAVLGDTTQYSITFIDSTLLAREFNFVFTVKPQTVLSVYGTNYTRITDSKSTLYFKDPDASNSITPGSTSILELDIYPYYSSVKSITVENIGTSEDKVTFEQILRTGEVTTTGETDAVNSYYYKYESLFPRMDYLDNGINVKPVSTKFDNVEAFNGKIYLKTLVRSGITEGAQFQLLITVTGYDNTVVTKIITLTAVNSTGIEMNFTYRISAQNRTVTATEDKETAPTVYIPIGQENFGVIQTKTIGFNGVPTVTAESQSGNVVINSNGTVCTKSADIGEEGDIVASSDIIVAGLTESKKLYIKYQVVDFVYEDMYLTTNGVNAVSDLTMWLTQAYKLQVLDGGYIGDQASAEAKIKSIYTSSCSVTTDENVTIDNNALQYWKIVDANNSEYALTADNLNLYGYSLQTTLGDNIPETNQRFGTNALIANTTLNPITIKCEISYTYNNGKFTICDQGTIGAETISAQFNTNPDLFTDLDRPAPIYSVEEFLNMKPGAHYILMNDLVLGDSAQNGGGTAYAPISTEVASFDGNSYKITINTFATTHNEESIQDTVNIGLFNTVSENTTIKNVKVVINSINTVDLSNYYRSVNYGTIAAVNNGVITNCSVSFEKAVYDGDNKLTEPTDSTFAINIITDESIAGDLVNNIGGLVGINNGFITNSKVEQPINIIVHVPATVTVDGVIQTGYTPKYIKSTRTSCVSTLSGSGNLAGLVATNSGKISSCYVKGINIINSGAQSSVNNTTAGLVGTNSSTAQVAYSYVEGTFAKPTTENTATETVGAQTPSTVRANADGSGIISNGNIGAFMYLNKGLISNCYANIKVTTNARASGFVFDTSDALSSVTDCFSLSDMEQNNNAHTPFTGTSATDLLANNNVDECYYLMLQGEDFGNTDQEPAIAMSVSALQNKGTFSAFAFVDETKTDSDENKYIWRMGTPLTNVDISYTEDNQEITHIYPQLISANQITLSRRKVIKDEESETITAGTTVDNYPTMGGVIEVEQLDNENNKIKVYNPLIIANATDFENRINENKGSEQEKYGNRYVLNLNMRIVSDFAFSDEAVSSLTSNMVFKGTLDGNNMTISNVRVNTSNTTSTPTSLGFIGELNGNPGDNYTFGATIKNVNFEFEEVYGNQVPIVGAVVGKIENGTLLNVSATGKNVVVIGKNIVGGLFGVMVGESRAVNLYGNLSVSSEYRNNQSVSNGYYLYSSTIEEQTTQNQTYYTTAINNLDKISYAGGIGGVVDVSNTNSEEMATQADIERATVTGETYVLGETVGGVFGLVAQNSRVRTAINEISATTNYLYATKVAGGVAGEVRGTLERSRIYHKNQSTIEAVALGKISTHANTTYFKGSCQAIGGLVGFLNNGTVQHSYSKIDVRNSKAQIAGGAVGRMLKGRIAYTYATGSVIAQNTIGGFVGHIAQKDALLEKEYGIGYGIGSANASIYAEGESETGKIKLTEKSTLHFNVAVNNWYSNDLAQIKKAKSYQTFIGSVTATSDSIGNVINIKDNYASAIIFTSSFTQSSEIIPANGHIFKTTLDCILGNLAEGKYATYDGVTLCHPAVMVSTQAQITNTSNYAIAKETIYKRFSSVFWFGKNDPDLRYIELINRSELLEIEISDWYELEDAVIARASVHLKLTRDIYVEGIVPTTFKGEINGNGYSFVFADSQTINNEKITYNSDLYFYNNGKANMFGIFSNADGATFENINIRIEKTLSPINNYADTYNTTFNPGQSTYVGLLVAYANNTTFNDCTIQTTISDTALTVEGFAIDKYTNEKLESIGNTANYVGGLAGFVSGSTIIGKKLTSEDNSENIVTLASSSATQQPTTFGVSMAVTGKDGVYYVGGVVGGTGITNGNACIIKDIEIDENSKVTFTYNKSETVSTNANSISEEDNKIANSIGGFIGLANKLKISNLTYNGTLDFADAASYQLIDTTKTYLNHFGLIMGKTEGAVDVEALTINEYTISHTISKGNGNGYELNGIGYAKYGKITSDEHTSININLTCDYGANSANNEIALNAISPNSSQTSANTSCTISVDVTNSTDQVIKTVANNNTTRYVYGGYDSDNTNSKDDISSTIPASSAKMTISTQHAAGSFSVSGGNITGYKGSSTVVVIPKYIGNTAITGIEGCPTSWGDIYQTSSGDKIKLNAFIAGKNNANECYISDDDNLGLYKKGERNDYETLCAYAKDNSAGSYTVNESCTKIAASAFQGSTNLRSVTGLSSVETIGFAAFSGCTSLQNVTDLSEVTTIGKSAFRDCKGLNTITSESSAPTDTYSTGIHLPTVKEISDSAFYGCTNLARIINLKGIETLSNTAFNGCTALKTIKAKAFYESGISGNLTVPNTIEDIESQAFAYCTSLTSVTMPRLITVGDSIFYGCTGLESVTYKEGTLVSDCMFYGCTNLTTVTTNTTNATLDGITSIGAYAFAYTGITTITVPSTLTAVGGQSAGAPWLGCKIKEITNNSANYKYDNYGLTTKDGSELVAYCTNNVEATKFSISGSLRKVLYGVFAYSQVENFVEDLKTNNNKYFIVNELDKGYEGLYFDPDGKNEKRELLAVAKQSGNETFAVISETDKPVTIRPYAFTGRAELEQVTISSYVNTICDNAFKDCENLETIYFYNTETPSISDNAFIGCKLTKGIFVDNRSYEYTGILRLTNLNIEGLFDNCVLYVTQIDNNSSITYASDAIKAKFNYSNSYTIGDVTWYSFTVNS